MSHSRASAQERFSLCGCRITTSLQQDAGASLPTYEAIVSTGASNVQFNVAVRSVSPPDLSEAWFSSDIVGTRFIDIAISDLIQNQDTSSGLPYRINIHLIRETTGTTDAELATSSFFIGAQERSISIRYLP